MESREQPRERALTGLLVIFFLALVWAGAIVMWYWPNHKPKEHFDSNGLNLSEVPASGPPARRNAVASGVNPIETATSEPKPSWAKPEWAQPFQKKGVVERPEWKTAALSFVRLANKPRYRNSPVLRLWAQDFRAYPDLRLFGGIYAKSHDLKGFVVATLRSSNFAKMLRKYGNTRDVHDFFMDLMAQPGVADSSRALIEDPDVFKSVKDLSIAGLPPLGQLMAAGAKGTTPVPENEAIKRFLQETRQK